MPQTRRYASHAQRQAAYHQRREEARKQQLKEKGMPALPAVPTIPGTARWRVAIANATALFDMVCQEMEDYADQRSEAWQESEKGDSFRERLDALIDARDNLADLDFA